MLVDNVKTSYPEAYIKLREDKRGDWSEIGVFVDPVLRNAGNILAAVITHPCSGAKWFLHEAAPSSFGRSAFKSKKLAIEAAINVAKKTAAYQLHTKVESK